MDKLGLVIKHEYSVRVHKKSFWIASILTPVLIVLVGAIIGVLAMANKNEKAKIAVLDSSDIILSNLKDSEVLSFEKNDAPIDSIKKLVSKGEYNALLVIPKNISNNFYDIENLTQIFYDTNLPTDIKSEILSQIKDILKKYKLESLNLDENTLKQAEVNLKIATFDLKNVENKDTSIADGVKFALAGIMAFILYIFIFITGSSVMNSTLEEKTTRVVEIIISSVKPFVLMLGKIISSGLIALTQLFIWIFVSIILSIVGITTFSAVYSDKILNSSVSTLPQNNEALEQIQNGKMFEILSVLGQIDFVSIFVVFLLFFILGYLLYSSFFAAAGAAVDSPNDANQFIVPITIPLILALYVGITVITNPNGPVAFWLSIIPLTSPIVMMVRIPFGVPLWQITLSITLLVACILVTIWIAGKVYKTGLLMYGSKPSYRDLWRWIKNS